MTQETDHGFAENCMLAALKEVQDTVRAYDTKAQIVGVGFIFTIGVIMNIGARLPNQPEFNTLMLILVWILAIGPIILFGVVLFPSRSIDPIIGDEAEDVRQNYYVATAIQNNLSTYLRNIEACDWRQEIAYEIMKVSNLRDKKRSRFILALYASAFSFMVVIGLQILNTLGIQLLGRTA